MKYLYPGTVGSNSIILKKQIEADNKTEDPWFKRISMFRNKNLFLDKNILNKHTVSTKPTGGTRDDAAEVQNMHFAGIRPLAGTNRRTTASH